MASWRGISFPTPCARVREPPLAHHSRHQICNKSGRAQPYPRHDQAALSGIRWLPGVALPGIFRESSGISGDVFCPGTTGAQMVDDWGTTGGHLGTSAGQLGTTLAGKTTLAVHYAFSLFRDFFREPSGNLPEPCVFSMLQWLFRKSFREHSGNLPEHCAFEYLP